MPLDLVELATSLASGVLHPRAALEHALTRLKHVDGALNLVAVSMVEQARERAAQRVASPFFGAPFLLKDAATAALPGIAQPLGSRLFRDAMPQHPSHLTRMMLETGLNPFAKTTTPEFSVLVDTYSSLNGVTRNPWDLSRSPGGSSGGSAAAVAARVVPAAHANDGAGSIRLPASFCGLLGLKPTRGRISLGPAIGEALGGTACEGVVSISVRDTTALLAALSRPQPGDPYTAPPLPADLSAATAQRQKRLRIALVLESPFDGSTSEDGSAAALAAAELCEAMGHEIVPSSLPIDAGELAPRYRRFYPSNCNRTIYAAMQARPEEDVLVGLDAFQCWFWEEYGDIQAMALVETLGYFNRMTRDIAEWMDQQRLDLWLSPTTAGAAPLVGHFDAAVHGGREVFNRFLALNPFTPIANLTGAASISIPLYWTPIGLPVGAQFTGRQGDEPLLLALASELERQAPWVDRVPPLNACVE